MVRNHKKKKIAEVLRSAKNSNINTKILYQANHGRANFKINLEYFQELIEKGLVARVRKVR